MPNYEWTTLSTLLTELAEKSRSMKLPPGDLTRARAKQVAVARYGALMAQTSPVLTDMARLAMLAGDRLVLHWVRPSAARLIWESDLHVTPNAAPALLRGPFMLEVRRPETGERLFGTTAAIGGYPFEGTTHLLRLQYPTPSGCAIWEPAWSEKEIPEGPPAKTSPLVDVVKRHCTPPVNRGDHFGLWASRAARFAVLAACMLEAHNSPLRIDEEQVTTESGLVVVTRNVFVDAAPLSPTQPEAGASGYLSRTNGQWVYTLGEVPRRWVE